MSGESVSHSTRRPAYRTIAAAAVVIVAVISASIFATSVLGHEGTASQTITCMGTPVTPSTTTLSSPPCANSPMPCVPLGESGPFGLRILFDSNQTPVVGARVIATNQPLVSGCVGSPPGPPLTNATTLTFTTNGTEWYSFDSGYDSSYSIVVTYSGESYNFTATFRPEYAYCATLLIPSGAVNVTGTEFQESCSSSTNTGAFSG